MNYPQIILSAFLCFSAFINICKCLNDPDFIRGSKRAYFVYVETMIMFGLLYWGGYWDCWLK